MALPDVVTKRSFSTTISSSRRDSLSGNNVKPLGEPPLRHLGERTVARSAPNLFSLRNDGVERSYCGLGAQLLESASDGHSWRSYLSRNSVSLVDTARRFDKLFQ